MTDKTCYARFNQANLTSQAIRQIKQLRSLISSTNQTNQTFYLNHSEYIT